MIEQLHARRPAVAPAPPAGAFSLSISARQRQQLPAGWAILFLPSISIASIIACPRCRRPCTTPTDDPDRHGWTPGRLAGWLGSSFGTHGLSRGRAPARPRNDGGVLIQFRWVELQAGISRRRAHPRRSRRWVAAPRAMSPGPDRALAVSRLLLDFLP